MQILNRPYEQYSLDPNAVMNEVDVLDVKTVVSGLIKIFKEKLYQLPSSHATKAYRLLVNHLELHYQKPVVFDNASSIRYIVSIRSCRTFVLVFFFFFHNDFYSVIITVVVQNVYNFRSRRFDFLTKLFFVYCIPCIIIISHTQIKYKNS